MAFDRKEAWMNGKRIVPAVWAAALFCSGCMAFNVGKPKTFTHSETITITESTPFRTDVLSVRGWQEQHTNNVIVGILAEVGEEFARQRYTETYSIREQRRLAIGFYPGGGEIFLMPKGALKSSVFYDQSEDRGRQWLGFESLHDPGQYVAFQSLGMLVTLGVPHVLSTAYSLFGAPFDSWECDHDLLVEEIADEKALRKFSSNELDRIDPDTRSHRSLGWLEPFSHCGLVGCHKYTALFVDQPRKGLPAYAGTETRCRDVAVTGPFIAELSIPTLNHSDWRRLSNDETQAVFVLPAVQEDCVVEAILSFYEDDSVNSRATDDFTRQVLAMAAGRTWRFDLSLKASDRAGPPPKMHLQSMVQSHPTPDFYQMTFVTAEDGWSYDHDSRRGWVRLRIPNGVSTEDARYWVRENIATILAEKDVLLEADKAPPSGVTYRSLGEKFENGILTVEFEAVQ